MRSPERAPDAESINNTYLSRVDVRTMLVHVRVVREDEVDGGPGLGSNGPAGVPGGDDVCPRADLAEVPKAQCLQTVQHPSETSMFLRYGWTRRGIPLLQAGCCRTSR